MERGHVRELQKFKDLLAGLDEVQECYSVTGDFDYVLKVIARDLPALSRFLMDTLMRLPGVAAVRSSVCMEEIKCTSALPLPS
jgi:Lrp/AsnC family transcriptional regulator, leucine-responsive regulatory protein